MLDMQALHAIIRDWLQEQHAAETHWLFALVDETAATLLLPVLQAAAAPEAIAVQDLPVPGYANYTGAWTCRFVAVPRTAVSLAQLVAAVETAFGPGLDAEAVRASWLLMPMFTGEASATQMARAGWLAWWLERWCA